MKERITITIDEKLLSWLDKKITQKEFSNRSHGLSKLVHEFQKEDK